MLRAHEELNLARVHKTHTDDVPVPGESLRGLHDAVVVPRAMVDDLTNFIGLGLVVAARLLGIDLIEKIGGRGLAKRSWMWGLAPLGKRSQSRAIVGTFELLTIKQSQAAGYILQGWLDANRSSG